MSLEPIAMGAIEPEATLADCEQALQQVERNAAIEQGIILRHVRDNRLYREAGFSAFEDWCEKRYGHTRQWAHQRIDLAQTAAELSTIVNTPQITSKDHARAIKPVIRDHGAEVAAEILTDAADGGKLTARAIDAAIQRHPATRPAEPESVYTVPADDYLGALNRYPELDVDGAEAGDIVRIAAMIDARPEHERDMRADAGSKWLRAKTEGRLDETPIDNDTEAAERIYKSAYLLLKDVERYADDLPDALLHADPVSRDIWERTLRRLADRAAALARSIPTTTLRSVK